MVANFPGPYELRFQYTVSGREHSSRHSLVIDGTPAVGTDFVNIFYTSKDSTSNNLSVWVDAYLNAISDGLNSGDAAFGAVELWSYAPLTFDASFVSSYVSSITPTGSGSTKPASQATFTFRTEESGLFKVILLDTVFDPSTPLQLATQTGVAGEVRDIVLSAPLSPIRGWDTSRPITPLKALYGQNESLFRKVYR